MGDRVLGDFERDAGVARPGADRRAQAVDRHFVRDGMAVIGRSLDRLALSQSARERITAKAH